MNKHVHPIRCKSLIPILTFCLTMVGTGWLHAEEKSTAPTNSVITITGSGKKIASREDIYGHNMGPLDWHGSALRPPVIWDVTKNAPDAAWDELTHAYPIHHMRYNVGNSYPWKDSVGSATERKIIKAPNWEPAYRTEAGLDEFLRWVESLPKKSEATLIASPFRSVQDSADLVAYCNATTGPMAEWRKKNGHPEPYNVKVWELGNETDWVVREDLDVTRLETEKEKKARLPVAEYVTLCKERIAAMRQVDPTIKIYAHAATAPFASSNPTWRGWHREVIRKMGGDIDGIAIHPYYDGFPVPTVIQSIDILAADMQELQPKGKQLGIWVSEHSKWIDYNKMENWPQSWGLSGAISAADFLLHCMARPEVKYASYWYYLGKGPWRVLDTDWDNGSKLKFGTGAHAMFQLLNAAYLPNFEWQKVDLGTNTNYPSGYSYTVTTGLFSDPASSRKALVAVNRSPAQDFTVRLPEISLPKGKTFKRLIVTGDSLTATNVPETPNAVKLDTSVVQPDVASDGVVTVVLPARSVTAWIWE